MEEIRTLRTEDIAESLRLSEFAFQYELPAADFERAMTDAKPEQVHACYVDGQLAAKVHILPLTVYVGGTAYSMGGLAGVATWPEYRRGGRVAKLLRHALTVMRDSGQTVSLLAPFSFAFYRRYGWEYCIDRKHYTLVRQNWPSFPDTGGFVRRSADPHNLASIYEPYAARYSGMLQRDQAWWERNLRRWGRHVQAIYYRADGVPEGYLIYQVKESMMTVYEWVHLTEDARRGLWNFVRNHDSMAETVKFVAPTDDELPFMLDNPRINQETVPYFMARIVDVERFLQDYPFVRTLSGQRGALSDIECGATQPVASGSSECVEVGQDIANLWFQIHDEHAPWNEGVYRMKLPLGLGQVPKIERYKEVPSTVQNLIEMDIQTLAALAFGYHRPETLHRLGRISGEDEGIQLLEQVIPRQTPFLADFF